MTTTDDLHPTVARCRQASYRLGAGVFLPPRAETVHTLASAGPVLEELDILAFSFGPHLLDLVDRLAEVDADELSVRYVQLFDAGVRGAPCPLTEADHLGDARSGEPARLRSQLERFQLECRVRPGPDPTITADHISVELETMAVLCAAEARHEDELEPGLADAARRRQRRLVVEHLDRWVPALGRRLAELDPDGVYGAAGRAVAALIHHDRQLLAALAPDSAASAVSEVGS